MKAQFCQPHIGEDDNGGNEDDGDYDDDDDDDDDESNHALGISLCVSQILFLFFTTELYVDVNKLLTLVLLNKLRCHTHF